MLVAEGSVRYRASGALKTVGPTPSSPPRPAERPGAGPFILVFQAPAPNPRQFPRRAPIKLGGKKWGPVQGLRGDFPGPGRGRRLQ